MRHQSAMQVLGCLKEHLGEHVNILRICSEINLSYQPTYFHVRELERLGVVRTLKQGRQVLCALRPSPPAYLWLGLLEEWLQQQTGSSLPLDLAPALIHQLRAGLGEQLLFLLLERSATPTWGVVGLPQIGRDALRWLQDAISRPGDLPADWIVWDRPALQRALQTPSWRSRLACQSWVLYGRERFWEWMLEAIQDDGPVAQGWEAATVEPSSISEVEFLD